ncbi:MAG: hypothetical protein AAFY41_17085, partial [Bacteroidota bacterium]
MLASRFYTGLGKGISIKKSWQEAIAGISIEQGNSSYRIIKDFYTNFQETENEKSAWEIKYELTSEMVAASWNLPSIAASPLFGLPLPGKYYFNLPECPYPGFKPFDGAHAGVFFGRGQEIRVLYNAIKDIYPVILVHGENFVGKTSLLKAGLLPRIPKRCIIQYVKVEEGEQLSLALKQALGKVIEKQRHFLSSMSSQHQELALEDIVQLREHLDNVREEYSGPEALQNALRDFSHRLINWLKEGAESVEDLSKTWKTAEAYCDRSWQERKGLPPMTIVIDQVENTFKTSKPEGDTVTFPVDFFDGLIDLFTDADYGAKSKLVLVVQNKYLEDFESALS